jgi:hypothetical protein
MAPGWFDALAAVEVAKPGRDGGSHGRSPELEKKAVAGGEKERERLPQAR